MLVCLAQSWCRGRGLVLPQLDISCFVDAHGRPTHFRRKEKRMGREWVGGGGSWRHWDCIWVTGKQWGKIWDSDGKQALTVPEKNELTLGSVSVASEKQFVWTIEGTTNRAKYRQKSNVQTEFSILLLKQRERRREYDWKNLQEK